ncbi:hypothetical protein CLE01_03390 [Cryobacterium levicorallinum]|nr:hypothetical protein CLE01_03390 [Cryobacterium levicorallinum]
MSISKACTPSGGVGDIDGIAGFGEGTTDDVRDADVILDNEHLHTLPGPTDCGRGG